MLTPSSRTPGGGGGPDEPSRVSTAVVDYPRRVAPPLPAVVDVSLEVAAGGDRRSCRRDRLRQIQPRPRSRRDRQAGPAAAVRFRSRHVVPSAGTRPAVATPAPDGLPGPRSLTQPRVGDRAQLPEAARLANGAHAAGPANREGSASCSTGSACRPRRPRATRTSSAAASANGCDRARARCRADPALWPTSPLLARCLRASADLGAARLARTRARHGHALHLPRRLGRARHLRRHRSDVPGRIVEVGPTESVWSDPRHPYTRALVDAVPHAREIGILPTELAGDVPDPAEPPPGCRFHPRCRYAFDRCRLEEPRLEPIENVEVACFAAHAESIVSNVHKNTEVEV